MHHCSVLLATVEGLSQRGRERGVLTPQFFKSLNFWNLTDFSLEYNELKSCNFWSFLAICYEISHNDNSKDIIKTHYYCYYTFWGKNVIFEQKEQDKSSDIEQQPPFGDRKISNIQPQNRGGGVQEFRRVSSIKLPVFNTNNSNGYIKHSLKI